MLARAVWDCCCKHGSKDPSVPGPVSIKVLNEEEVEASLIDACDRGDLDSVEGLLLKRANPNARAEDGSPSCRDATPLVTASRRGHVSVLYRLLLEPGIEVNATTQDEHNNIHNGQTALHWAATAGHASAARALLNDSRTEREPMNQLGLTPLMLAAQQDNVDVLKTFLQARVDANLALNVHGRVRTTALTLAITSGNVANVRALLECGQIRINEQFCHIHTTQCSALDLAVVQRLPSLVQMLLKFSADPDLADERGVRAIERAYQSDAVEIVMILLLFGADTKDLFKPVRRLQVRGDAPKLRALLESNQAAGADAPPLHKAALRNDVASTQQQLSASNARSVASTIDGGCSPAVYYALELGHVEVARAILVKAYGVSEKVAEDVVATATLASPRDRSTSSSSKQRKPSPQTPEFALHPIGARTFMFIKALLADGSKVCFDAALADGAFSIIAPWCGSASALGFFTDTPEAFVELRSLCEERLREANLALDRQVSHAKLRQLASIGPVLDYPVRQDSPGLLPPFEYFLNEPLRQKMGGDHEVFAARTLAVLGLALQSVFKKDMEKLLQPLAGKVTVAAPKTFQRMLNKLLSPNDLGGVRHGLKPKSMRNVDVLRLRFAAADNDGLVEAFELFKKSFRVLRVTNNHSPDTSYSSGSRCIQLVFAYDPGVTFKDIFGDTGTGTGEATMNVQDHWGRLWLSLVKTWGDTLDVKWCLQALWYIARQQPTRRIIMAAEVELLLADYAACIDLRHLLINIQRSETGPGEMVRDLCATTLKIGNDVDEKVAEMAKSRALDIRIAPELVKECEL